MNPGRSTPLVKVVAATVAAQMAIVAASLTVPVLSILVAASAELPADLVGYYSALIYGCAAATSLATPLLIRRWGGIRLHQGMLVMTALALAALLPAAASGFAASALVLGLAYGPMNPASTVLLARYTPPSLRGRIFSLKQTAVPAGGAVAGFVTPLLAVAVGWRGAAIAIALVCLALALAIQRWRDEIDGDGAAESRPADAAFGLPLRLLLSNRGLRRVAAAAVAFGAVQFSFAAMFPTVLVDVGWDLRDAGRALSVALVVGVVFRVLWGALADRIGPRPVLGVMGAMMGGAALCAAFIGPGWPGGAILALSALFGLSAFCWAGIGLAEAVRQVPAPMIPEASAALIALTFIGALVGPALFSTITVLADSFRPAFLLLASASAVPALLLLRPGRTRPH